MNNSQGKGESGYRITAEYYVYGIIAVGAVGH